MKGSNSIKWRIFTGLSLITHILPFLSITTWLKTFLIARTVGAKPDKALRFLLHLDNYIYWLTGQKVVEYGQGIPVKQRYTGYVEYLVEQAVASKGPFLDVGCGSGVGFPTGWPVPRPKWGSG